MLLQMLNGTVQLSQDITFLMPGDHELSESSVSLDHLEDFLVSAKPFHPNASRVRRLGSFSQRDSGANLAT